MPFIFFDTETSHHDNSFSQIFQFAAIYTDDSLNPVEGREINVRCRRRPHIVPSPGALIVTGVEPNTLDQAEFSHYEMINNIVGILDSWGPAIFIGHNSIRFDEELFRRALFLSLHKPYYTNTNQNRRMDTLRLSHGVHSLRPSVDFRVPEDPSAASGITFRLGPLVRENGVSFSEEEAHDALGDVKATIELAKVIKTLDVDYWNHMVSISSKEAGLDYIQNMALFLMAERYGRRFYKWPMTYAGLNPSYTAEFAVFDLNYDPVEYLGLSANDLVGILNQSPKVIRRFKLNACPLMSDVALSWGDMNFDVSLEVATSRAQIIKDNPKFLQKVGKSLELKRELTKYEESHEIEKRIYEGFANSNDENLMERFHQIPWEERPKLIDQFSDGRFKEIAKLILYEYDPNLLSREQKIEVEAFINSRINGPENSEWISLAGAMSSLREERNRGEADTEFLQRIEDYLQAISV